jgi:hypothetical protein
MKNVGRKELLVKLLRDKGSICSSLVPGPAALRSQANIIVILALLLSMSIMP